jgi:hypothetical protein
MAANEAGRGSRLYVQSVDGGEPAAISGEGVRLAPYVMHAISPDGRVVVAEGPDGSAALYPLAGGEPHPIAGLGDDLVPVGWTDTPNVLFARTRQLARLLDIYRVDVVSGRRERWRTIGESDPSGAPRVVVVLVTPDGRQYAYHTNQMMSDLYLVSGLFD